MTSLLLIMIYLAFISLGLPDSLLGSAWPTMYRELGASVSWAGIISMIIAAGTIVSSLASDRLTRRLGAGRVTAVSVCITAVALFGFSVSSSFPILCLWAIPYGLGAGSVDAALNNFVALHYPARHMSWLHCMWGVGASVGPVIMGWAISGGMKWNGGYRTIAIMQAALTAALFLSLPLWKKVRNRYEEEKISDEKNADGMNLDAANAAEEKADRYITEEESTNEKVSIGKVQVEKAIVNQATADKNTAAQTIADQATVKKDMGEKAAEVKRKESGHLTLPEILRLRGVKEVLICFFCYCALESTAGMWAASYCTIYQGISAEQAARWASLFYLGITAGRFICGFITMKVNDRNMIRLGQAVTAAGVLLVMLPFGSGMVFWGLILIGCGCAPIYPSIIHETPENFGADLSQSIIGIQMASAYVGSCLVPPLFGLAAQYINIALYPYFIAVILALMIVMAEKLHRKVKG